MANLTWSDVVIIGAVATVGFTLLSYWFSGVMNRRNWSWQVKPKAKAPVASAPRPDAPAKP
ncbi:MAG: hypothetical protein WC876_09475 [Candidatus Thermoplasmatota archaeon]